MNIVPFGSVCSLQNGRAFKPEEWSVSGTPIVRIQNLNDETKPFNYCDFEVEKRFRVESGDLLFSWSGTPGTSFGAFFWNRGKGFLNQHIFRVDVDERNIDKNYLRYAINSKLNLIIDQAHGGVGLKHITKGKLEAIEIPLPPLSEQKRIAAILDKADTIRRKRQQATQLADDFLRAVFLEMFGNPVSNPKGWEVRAVGEICNSIVPGRDKPKSFTGSIPWITTNELSHLGITHRREDGSGLSADEIAEVNARVVPKGSVIMTCVGDLGVVTIAGEDMVINQQLHAFLPTENLAPAFLSYSLAWQKGYMLKMASSTTLPYMNKSVCNSVPIMRPPKRLQDEFDALVSKVSDIKSRMFSFANERAFQCLSNQAFSSLL
ncbi:restriction endonuclease subunit S [Pseudomonas alliivorans]|nr:restriction endonuclease subunit S [Pseudomonas alliivorans]